MEQKEQSFEQMLEQVEDIVAKLQDGSIPLKDALKLYEDGFKLVKASQGKLNEAREKLELLKKEDDADEEAEA